MIALTVLAALAVALLLGIALLYATFWIMYAIILGTVTLAKFLLGIRVETDR